MTLLYRSPNVLIDKHEWHVVVRMTDHGVVVTEYKWRDAAALNGYWHSRTDWPLPAMPKGMSNVFQAYRKSIRAAIESAQRSPIVRRKAA